jgi:signal transduction histidine kinase
MEYNMHPHSTPGSSWLSWFTGGSEHAYMTLIHCMSGDWLWIIITVTLDFAIAAGYAVIAMHWWRNQKRLPASPAKSALASMRNIFVFCGLCGYLFIPIKMVWPAWRLYDIFAAVLVYFTWRYAWNARELKVLYSELGRSEKLASDLQASQAESRRKTHFLNAISHDLRTPLNGLTLQAELAAISADANDVESMREALGEIKNSAKATSDLLNRFLELARLDWSEDENRVSEFEVDAFLENIVSIHQADAGQKGLELRVVSPPGLLAKTDRIKLERILINLISNAIKFTPAGHVQIAAEQAGSDLHIHVSDTGIGIHPEHQASLFQEFFQVQNHERDRKKGFGLGLAISRRLTEQLGGTLACESQAGRGTTFRINLPNAARIPGDRSSQSASAGACAA